MFELIKKMFTILLTSIVSVSNHTKCALLSNDSECTHVIMTQLTPINLHPNEDSQEYHYSPFAVKSDVLEILILLMTYIIKYMFQTKQKI